MPKSGIYKIRHKDSGKVYIGRAKDISNRLSTHKYRLNLGKHVNRYLQAAWTKYKAEAFTFEVVELCPIERLIEKESFWIAAYESSNQAKGYNLMPAINGATGHSAATRAKISVMKSGVRNYAYGKKRNPEIVAKIAKTNTGKKRTQEQRERLKHGRRNGAGNNGLHKVYSIYHVSGATFVGYTLRQWALDQGLSDSKLYAVINGKRKQYKGWYAMPVTPDQINGNN